MLETVGSNPGTEYWMDIFTLICCKNCIVFLKRPKINKNRLALAHFLKKMDARIIRWSVERILSKSLLPHLVSCRFQIQ